MTKYVYDNEDILLELNSANAIVDRYTHGPGTGIFGISNSAVGCVNNRPTILAREIQQLESAGYKQIGDYLVPPGR